MGFVHVPVKLFAPSNGQEPIEVEMLVDTGAIFTVVPRPVLEQLGIQSRGTRLFQAIDGKPIEREVGGIEIEVEGRRPPSPVPVVFGDADDGAVLGVTALEGMGLKVDPVAGILEPTELKLWSAAERRVE